MTAINFDVQAAPESDRPEPIPAGEYLMCIRNTDIVATKLGNGSMVKIEGEVLEGQYAGRKVFDNINIVNPSEQAARIGQAQLRQLCEAVGITGVLQDTVELHEKPFIGKVKIDVDQTGQYDPKNTFGGFKSREAAAAPATAPAPATGVAAPVAGAPAAAAPAPGSAPGWAQ